ncbi:MAG: hypothetical protein HYU28_05095 [Actinobacteria bacterium]|nr:hypothetical protein [Actinomycetota bacterium]
MFVEISRLLVVLACTMTGLAVGRAVGDASSVAQSIGGALGTLVGYVGGGVLGRGVERVFGVVEHEVERYPTPRLFAGGVGALVGGMGGAFLAFPLIVIFPSVPVILAGTLVMWVFGTLGVRVAWRKSEELFAMAGLSSRPLVRSSPYELSDGHIVDTSAVMDGNLSGLVRAGLIGSHLFVPRQEGPVGVRVLDDEVPERDDVDGKLVALARRLQLRLLTCDVNLQHVAEIQGVTVVNLRKLASDLRPTHAAGDHVELELVRVGREAGQGVGYLDDGTMVVVNEGDGLVGAGIIRVEIVTVVPTSVGRLLFARPVTAAAPAPVEAASEV